MLLTKEQLKLLKKGNVSKDAAKTMERVQQDYRAASTAEKKAVVALMGQHINTLYRVYNTGIVGARIALALAQTLNVTPFYYTGETDERGPADDKAILAFLEAKGYKALLKELDAKPAKRKYTRKPKEEAAPAAETTVQEAAAEPLAETCEECGEAEMEDVLEITLAFPDDPEMNQAVAELTETEAAELLHTLFIRAKGGGDAKLLLDVVKRCLLR